MELEAVVEMPGISAQALTSSCLQDQEVVLVPSDLDMLVG